MIKKLLFFLLMFSPAFACQMEINATIKPQKNLLSATVLDDNGQLHIIKKQMPHMIQKDFVSILDDWYPQPTELCQYRLQVTMPSHFTVISESETIMIEEDGDTKTTHFSLSQPINRINIIASDDFIIQSEHYNDINISTYLFSQHQHLSNDYIQKTKSYIDRYEELLGTFPYKAFNIIENRFQTGYSMPTFTLIGDRIIDKPFLLDISLGHEILHQWLGNSLFNDFQKGNWIEGITTYLADHQFKKEEAEDVAYRKNILHNYVLQVEKNSSFPLGKFTHRHDKVSAAIGYGKGTFAFHMLQKSIGEEHFDSILKAFYKEYTFQEVSYHDIERFFSKKSGKDLRALFTFLFEREEMIDLQVTDLKTSYYDQRYRLDFTLSTGVVIEGLKLPVTILVNNNPYHFYIENNTSISLSLEERPHTLVLDPYYDLFRTLSSREKLYTLSMALKDSLPDLDKLPTSVEKGFFVSIKADKETKEGYTLQLQSSDKKQTTRMRYRLPHYGSYQKLHFINGQLVHKEKPKSQNGIKLVLPLGATIDKVVKDSKDTRLFFVGEYHDNYAHHLNQKKIIQTLYEKGKKVSIGLEMFQRRFQPILDAYLAKEIDEKTFLEKSQYFKRWGYDYHHYKPIIDYAREHNIPLFALNMEREIIKKVSKSGIALLDEKEKVLLPNQIDLNNYSYKERLMQVLNDPAHLEAIPKEMHPNPHFLYESQVLWDETMAETTANYLNVYPDTIMIVLAGNGHLEYYDGIPARVQKRTDVSMQVILQDSPFDACIGDYILTPKEREMHPSPKLGVHLAQKSLTVLSVVKDSLAAKLGIKEGDLILAFNNKPLQELADLKLALYLSQEKKDITITIKREKKVLVLP